MVASIKNSISNRKFNEENRDMHWSDIEEIVAGLEETYNGEEIPGDDNLEYLKEMVLSLADFEDQEVEVSKDNLKQIMESWIELRTEE